MPPAIALNHGPASKKTTEKEPESYSVIAVWSAQLASQL